MNIHYLSSSTLPSRDANSIHVMKMSQALSRAGHKVTLYAMAANDGDKTPKGSIHAHYGVERSFDINVFSLPSLPKKTYFYSLLLGLWCSVKRPDLSFCRDLAAAFIVSLFRVPVVFESHSPVAEKGAIANFLFRRMIKRRSFKRLIVITQALQDYYETQYPELKGKTIVAPDGADALAGDVVPVALLPENVQLQVGYVGHLYHGKGIELIAQLAPLCPWAAFHIVGGKQSDIDHWMDHCRDIPNMHFHGFVPHDEVASYIKAFDVALLPNQPKVLTAGGKGDIGQWTSPLKAFEYMAAGKAIVASDLPVLREVMIDNENCVLCDPENPRDWCRALERLRDSSALTSRLGERALARFLQHYTWQARSETCINDLFTI